MTRSLMLSLRAGAAAVLVWPFGGAAQPSIEGVWMLDGSFNQIGYLYSEPDFTAEGQRRFDAFDILTDDPSLLCIPSGLGRIWDNPGSPIEFQLFDDRVEILYEMFDLRRTIFLNQAEHPQDPDPSTVNLHGERMPTMGHSIGWYEEDVLVVETTNFAASLITTVRRYMPQSVAMRSTERFYRDGDQLAMEISYTDPVTMTEPLTGDYRFMKSDYGVVVYGCTPENAGYE